MYSNYMYSNAPASSRRGGGSWVYVNGELYHYGRPGMKWYQTIFGGYDNPKSMTYIQGYGKQKARNAYEQKMTTRDSSGRNPSLGARLYNAGRRITGEARAVGSGLRAVGRTAKDYGSYVKGNIKKYYVDEAKTNAMSKAVSRFGQNRAANAAYFDTKKPMTHLESFMNDQIDDAEHYVKALKNNKSVMNIMNLAIQNAQFNIMKGVNNFLNNLGVADKVDKFLSKFLGESNAVKSARLAEKSAKILNPGPTNTRGYERAEDKEPTYNNNKVGSIKVDKQLRKAAKRKSILV